MVAIHIAYTSPINSSSGPKSEPQLTIEQVWAGLQRKIRHGDEFVPVIESCDVISEYDDPKSGNHIVEREAVFKPGTGPSGKVKEVCESFGQTRVDFHQMNGSLVMNLISRGPDGELFMTYSFDWLHPEVDEGDSEKVEELRKRYTEGATGAVENSIKSIREMVVDGRIKV